ncbi:hypothetical protein [Streptomyces sp. NPDC048611]|uniref:hypothetical protein n=1 Tax=Streptomyces sp. NPDC048611 TaxID=3155635 RepID=UPI003433811C
MSNSAAAPRRASRRRARSVTVLAAALLTAAPLLGSASPAVAAEENPIRNDKLYESEDDIQAALTKTAPVGDSETVMGYPKGIDRDANGAVMPFDLRDVQDKYDPQQAVQDAKQAAQKYADDANNPAGYRDVAQQLVTGWGKKNAGNPAVEVRKNTTDDKMTDKYTQGPAESYCAGKDVIDGSPHDVQASPCVFVGKLDTKPGSKYPKIGSSSAVLGGGKKTYKVTGQVTDEKSTTDGWSVGGKFTPKVTTTPANGGTGGELGGEAGFTYSWSVTTTERKMTGVDDQTEVTFPSDKKGSLQGRRDGAYYVGYLVVRYADPKGFARAEEERLIAIPARVYVQSPKSSTPVSYFTYTEPVS